MDEKDKARIADEDTFPGEDTQPKPRPENVAVIGEYNSGVYEVDLNLIHPTVEGVMIPVRARMRLIGFGFQDLRCFVGLGMRRTGDVYQDAYYNGLVVGSELPQSHEMEVPGRRIPDLVSAGEAAMYFRWFFKYNFGFDAKTRTDDETLLGKDLGHRIGVLEEDTEEIVGDDMGRRVVDLEGIIGVEIDEDGTVKVS
ncbi:hypothetical protein HOG17_02595 [Candidatus Peregrinibacteria bacterium]|nr:hypothetical protein [Candidatus Peregrinibacteria bacterium]MBT4147933.1 hypothetical protein [Candidatus Peregrinibacteria bacterium]MBT4366371.1 hypothetical protein [Candidatus Peregrinibacteria bacterium]MBT4456099.1 hypothetical protein [Candidatus Peregrinibacteria bacterium]